MQLYTYAWKNNTKRAELYGRTCRLIARGPANSRLVEFVDNGQREIVSGNAIRKIRIGLPITRTDALKISRQTLTIAESERRLIAEAEVVDSSPH